MSERINQLMELVGLKVFDEIYEIGYREGESSKAVDYELKIEDLEDRNGHLEALIQHIGETGEGMAHELWEVGCSDVLWSEDCNTRLQYIGPWIFIDHEGDTFIEAVEKSYQEMLRWRAVGGESVESG